MGRPQTFDTADVVRAARATFWEHGYEDASMPRLEVSTGLRRSSLYHAFGSKRGLFDAAVTSYLDEVVRPRLAALTAPDVAPDAVIDYFAGLRAALASPGTVQAESGCLLINAAGAPIGKDPVVRETVAAYRAELRTAVRAGVVAHFPDRSAAEHDRVADLCTALLVSALLLTRVDHPQALANLDAALDLLA
ncbi:TetR/AcrR family transcriptional regulator [Oerskovia flava]|uniref:TetR/AcrR family transcriptional regulator n=1 Tax=Oerskovia flava TaxID=2986422 RepID=UPI00223F2408|nr:TetR/AcrR family transcriptional regulator [Oerskovia sp. JB1-3-2]